MGSSLVSQSQQILDWMKQGNGITQMQAVRMFGCFRLSARIFDLKAGGHDIETVNVVKKDKNGRTKQFARYYLKGHLRSGEGKGS